MLNRLLQTLRACILRARGGSWRGLVAGLRPRTAGPVIWRLARLTPRRARFWAARLIRRGSYARGFEGPRIPKGCTDVHTYAAGFEGPKRPKGVKNPRAFDDLRDWGTDATWEEIQDWSRRQVDICTFSSIRRNGAAVWNRKTVNAQYKRFTRTVGGWSFWIASCPYFVIAGGLAFGGLFAIFASSQTGGGGTAGIQWTTAHTIICVAFFGLSALPMSFPLQLVMKFNRAYGPLRTLEFASETEPWRITGIAETRVARLAYMNVPNAFSGSADESGLRRGPVHLTTGHDAPLNASVYADIHTFSIAEDLHLGFGARASGSAQHETLRADIMRGQPAVIGVWFDEMLKDENGRRVLHPILDRIMTGGIKPFEGAAATQTRSLVTTSIEAGRLKYRIGRKRGMNLADIGLIGYCVVLAILVFMLFSSGFQVDITSIDIDPGQITDAIQSQTSE